MGEQEASSVNSSISPVIPSSSTRSIDLKIDPIIALIDMDCFYVQVELRREPEFRGKPAIVVQYKTRFKGGGIIALSYEARAKGVKRFHHADEAREVCPEVKVFVVPELNGKADLTSYRDAGAEVIEVMKKHFSMVERASVDEAYVDLTAEVSALLPRYLNEELTLDTDQLGATCISGSDSLESWLNQVQVQRQTLVSSAEQKQNLNHFALAIAGKLINELREDIFGSTQFHCSAGISYSKTLAKLACEMNKPKKQTILPAHAVGPLFARTKIEDVRFLGGKLGKLIVENFGITTMGELCQVSKTNLLRYFDLKTAEWLMSVSVGQDNETVQPRDRAKSIGCSKNFLGREALRTRDDVRKWISHFCDELSVRLKKDQAASNRTATLLTAHCSYMEDGQERKHISKCAPLTSYEQEDLSTDSFTVADKCLTALGYQDGRYAYPIIGLGIVASKMKDGLLRSGNRIESYFNKSPQKESLPESAAKKESEEERTSQKEEENGDCIVLSSTSDQNEQRRPVKSEEPLIVKLPDCLPTTSKHLDPVPQPTAFPTGRGVDFKTTYQTEVLLNPDFRIHRCSRCSEVMWYPSMAAEHADYHVALDLSREAEPDNENGTSTQPRKKLRLMDVVVTKKPPKKPTTAGSQSAHLSTLDKFLVKKAL